MCHKLTVLSLAYVVVFVAVVKCDSGNAQVTDFLSQGNIVRKAYLEHFGDPQ